VFGLHAVRCLYFAQFYKFLETCLVEFLVDVKICMVYQKKTIRKESKELLLLLIIIIIFVY